MTSTICLARSKTWRSCFVVGTGAALVVLGGFAGTSPASAAQAPVGLGTATSFAVLAGTTVTNTGPTTVSGDLGVSPGRAVAGFPPGRVSNGAQHKADAVALQAKSDLTAAYIDAAGRILPTVESNPDLGGKTLTAGVYKVASGMSLTGTVTLDAKSDPSAVFIFQAGSTLITGSSSTVKLTGGAQACNVFWQVGSSATLGTRTTFVGSILALTSASVQTGATVSGRVLARNGQVSLHSNTITRPTCSGGTTTQTVTSPPSATTPPGGGVPTGVPAGSGGEAATSSPATVQVAITAGLGGFALLGFGGFAASRRRGRGH